MKPRLWGLTVAVAHFTTHIFVLVVAFDSVMKRPSTGSLVTSYDRLLANIIKVLDFPLHESHAFALLSALVWGVAAGAIATIVQNGREIPQVVAPSGNVPQ